MLSSPRKGSDEALSRNAVRILDSSDEEEDGDAEKEGNQVKRSPSSKDLFDVLAEEDETEKGEKRGGSSQVQERLEKTPKKNFFNPRNNSTPASKSTKVLSKTKSNQGQQESKTVSTPSKNASVASEERCVCESHGTLFYTG